MLGIGNEKGGGGGGGDVVDKLMLKCKASRVRPACQ